MPKNPANKKQFFKYNPLWAKTIAQNVLEEHTRAADFLGEISGIKAEKIWLYLATGSPKWHIVRDILHKLTKQIRNTGESACFDCLTTYTTTHLYSNGVALLSDLTEEWAIEDLTALRDHLTIQGQGFKGYKGMKSP
jgi:hypothetical protein